MQALHWKFHQNNRSLSLRTLTFAHSPMQQSLVRNLLQFCISVLILMNGVGIFIFTEAGWTALVLDSFQCASTIELSEVKVVLFNARDEFDGIFFRLLLSGKI